MNYELKPCPFCGGMPHHHAHNVGRQHFVRCKTCGIRTTNYESAIEAEEAWNTRSERACRFNEFIDNPCYKMQSCDYCGFEIGYVPSEFKYCPGCGSEIMRYET